LTRRLNDNTNNLASLCFFPPKVLTALTLNSDMNRVESQMSTCQQMSTDKLGGTVPIILNVKWSISYIPNDCKS